MNEDKAYRLIQYLANGEFCSGERLAQLLAVSRTTVATYVKQFGQLGLDIFSVKGKGYRLVQPLSLLDIDRLQAELSAHSPKLLHQVDSTNAWLNRHQAELSHGQLVMTEYQSAGRGRRGRAWQTPYAGQLCMSLLWCLQDGIEAAMGLSLAVGLAIVEALEAEGYRDLGLKWPNDIYLGSAKLGGVLIEMQGQANSTVNLVIGLGVNVRVTESKGLLIDQAFAQLEVAGEPTVDRTALTIAIVHSLNQMFDIFKEQGFVALQQRWNRYDIFRDKNVTLHFSEHKQVSGIAKGVDRQGQLLVEQESGLQAYMAGEVSLRGQ
ncbi:bifunctional biotin--[acetyl-CoA-carboxylase] ligase/biotin operon repressor BirA [Agarivorans sp. QJM3NY_25]|uniref:bifunctional biotin--[acetyl-CoA-carboxylase] ligase/biotin operon repressor BirA n=1 Tax=Agarivorans sp. QJM3NY_25 TaxID=3421430 RepID=UPI003D7CEFC4